MVLTLCCFFIGCPEKVWVKGFDRHSSGLYIKQGSIKQQVTGEEKYVYHHKTKNICIWWHSAYRHWWLGSCQNIPENVGIAYLQPDNICPHEGIGGDWQRSGTDIPILSGLVLEKSTE